MSTTLSEKHGKVSASEYTNIHAWLRKNFGSAKECEGDQCKGKSLTFEWALKRGEKYEKNRDNFLRLCKSCHCIYDQNPDTSRKRSNSAMGRLVSKQTREKLRKAHLGKTIPPEIRKKMSEGHKGLKASIETRKKMSTKRKGAKMSEESKLKISLWRIKHFTDLALRRSEKTIL